MGRQSTIVIILGFLLFGCGNEKKCKPAVKREIMSIPIGVGDNELEFEIFLLMDNERNCQFDSVSLISVVQEYIKRDSLQRKIFQVDIFLSDENFDLGETLSQDWSKLREDRIAEIVYDSSGNLENYKYYK